MAAVAQAPCLMDPANQSMSQRMKWKGVRFLKADGSEATCGGSPGSPQAVLKGMPNQRHAEPAVPRDQRRGKGQRGIELQGVRGQWVACNVSSGQSVLNLCHNLCHVEPHECCTTEAAKLHFDKPIDAPHTLRSSSAGSCACPLSPTRSPAVPQGATAAYSRDSAPASQGDHMRGTPSAKLWEA